MDERSREVERDLALSAQGWIDALRQRDANRRLNEALDALDADLAPVQANGIPYRVWTQAETTSQFERSARSIQRAESRAAATILLNEMKIPVREGDAR